SSHTGSLAGDDSTANALLASAGVTREYYLRDLFNTAQVFDKCPLPRGKNLAILTNAGGPGIIATDTATEYGIDIAQLSDQTKAKLRDALPPQASTRNPVDMIASAPAEHYMTCGDILLSAPEVDMLLVIYLYITGKNDLLVTANLEELKAKYPDKPIVAVYMTTPDFTERVHAELPNCSIPIFNFTVDAIHGLHRLIQRQEYLQSINTPTPIYTTQKDKVATILENAKQNNISILSVFDSLNVFSHYGLPVPAYGIATNLDEAIAIADKISYPVVLKISSTKITHKTDIGGVVVGIQSREMLIDKWTQLTTRLHDQNVFADIDGIVIMRQISGSGRELVAGIVQNNDNPPLMMFGMGGIFIEALHEVAFRPCPLTLNDTSALINSTKAKAIMGNLRGMQSVDEQALSEVLLRLSQLVTDHPNIVELDANPIMLDGAGNIFVVDARIVIKK
ncbi:MAG: acetate--CoA ligase family protein, partial [Clostridia bacterium]|nr:acetate--CoA ligase family protein [Clostridia bacterium]